VLSIAVTITTEAKEWIEYGGKESANIMERELRPRCRHENTMTYCGRQSLPCNSKGKAPKNCCNFPQSSLEACSLFRSPNIPYLFWGCRQSQQFLFPYSPLHITTCFGLYRPSSGEIYKVNFKRKEEKENHTHTLQHPKTYTLIFIHLFRFYLANFNKAIFFI
jgi:hypothetical protein